ncbi:translation machinery-associated protein 16 [Parageobacillus thermoglucosidasius]|nr:translation machinery-associated protein 16 [Parageobacillus thermoglucosidasius]MED4946465.1 translation machinery-associated protein 16 [Parageobacillus thermoglucosidasius]MED4984026.1 translation machinery-associated protein 16 [Parageobacillus thermoglucosidasius]
MKPWPKWFRFRYYADEVREVGHTCSVSGARDIIEIFDWLQLSSDKIIEFYVDQRPLTKQEIHELFDWVDRQRPKYEEEVKEMKNGKKPTKRQKEIIKQARLNPDNWLVVKNLPDELHIVHRETGRQRVIPA